MTDIGLYERENGPENDGAHAIYPLLVDCKTAAGMIGVGISTFYAMDRSGELGPPGLRLRRRRLWPREELVDWVRAGCPSRARWLALRQGKEGS